MSAPFATLTLDTPNDSFVFTDAEVPAEIVFGGSQLLDRHVMIGGRRRINALGADDAPLQWSGMFLYASAVDRARFLDSVRRRGQQCTLSWDKLRYQVVIDQFRATYKYPFRVPYWISFEIIEDETALLDSVPAVTPAQSMATDMARMGSLSNCIGDSTLNGLIGDLQDAFTAVQAAAQPIANGLKAVTSFISGVANCADQVVNAAENAVTSVTAPLAAVASRVQTMITSAENIVATGGGVLPGVPAATNIYNALSKANAAVQLPELYELRSITTRMQVNLPLTAAPSSLRTITVGGGDLYTIASQQYGDATRWTDIAKANGLTDPVLSGINTLIIPA
jgi:hypothetical protein